MTLSAPKQAALRGLADLANSTDQRGASPQGWDLAEVQIAARSYPAGDAVTVGTLNGLRHDRLVAGPAGRYWLTEFGATRLREGL